MGKPQCLVRLQVISVLRYRKYHENTREAI